MDIVERFTAYTELVTASFENTMGTMERVHQGSVDLSVSLFEQLGFWQDRAERFRVAHEKGIHTVYSHIVDTNNEFAAMLVQQAHNLDHFFRPGRQDESDQTAAEAEAASTPQTG